MVSGTLDFYLKNPMYPTFILVQPSGLSSLQSLNQDSCITTKRKPWPNLFASKKNTESVTSKNKKRTPKIAIIGGGICGVTAAKAILSRMNSSKNNIEITIFESDLKSYDTGTGTGTDTDTYNTTSQQPQYWKAATARNANSLGEIL